MEKNVTGGTVHVPETGMSTADAPMGVCRDGESAGTGRLEFVVIGLTDCRQPWFAPDVVAEIRSARVFSGGRRHHEIVAGILPADARWIDITVPIDAVFDMYENYRERIVVFASGDPLFFGFANTIQARLPFVPIRLYPAFNSLQMLAHRMAMPYHDMCVVSLTGRPWHEFDRALIECRPLIGVLTDRKRTPAAMARRMIEYGYETYMMTVGENLGNAERGRVTSLTVGEAACRDFSSPNCVILNATSRLVRRFGIPDTEFEHLEGRARMITKMPVRLLSLQALGLPSRGVLWDIGFCTGSVSIEAKLQFPHLEVVAFERRTEGERLMSVNARRFGAPGITTVIGDFMQCDISSLPRPDAVFIGGHGGRLAGIMERVAGLMTAGGVVVMNSVTPQSREAFIEAARTLGMALREPLHVAVDNHNPIDILAAGVAAVR